MKAITFIVLTALLSACQSAPMTQNSAMRHMDAPKSAQHAPKNNAPNHNAKVGHVKSDVQHSHHNAQNHTQNDADVHAQHHKSSATDLHAHHVNIDHMPHVYECAQKSTGMAHIIAKYNSSAKTAVLNLNIAELGLQNANIEMLEYAPKHYKNSTNPKSIYKWTAHAHNGDLNIAIDETNFSYACRLQNDVHHN